MSHFAIDKNKPIPELELSLHRPNGEQVGSLTDAKERVGTFKYGQYNELEITIPKYVERRHKSVPYSDFEKIRDKYLVKATYGNMFSEYLVVTYIENYKEGIPQKKVTLKSRQYELNGRILRNLKALSYTQREIMELALDGTNWTVGEIDEELTEPNEEGLVPRRSFDETKITSLNLLYKMAQTFGGILRFDTFNRTVSLYKPENAQYDFGLTASYGKYIKSLNETINAESNVTRLFIYGKDNLTINEANPTGLSYLEDFSYYMQGYETDENDNVISSSPYMSDGLCQAIIDYNLLLIQNESSFKNLLNELKPLQTNLIDLQVELSELNTELELIKDRLDIAKASNSPTQTIKDELNAKQIEIDDKQSEIDDVEVDIQIVENDIQDLRTLLSVENNFTPEQIIEKNDFIIEGEWTDENYFDVNELYEKGKEIMKKMREPNRDLDLSLVQFLDTVESQRDWDRIGLGYIIHTNYEPLDIEFTALISEIKIGFDGENRDLGIVISNVDYKSNKQQFLEMLYGTAISTSDRVNNNKEQWNENVDRTDYLEEFINNPWDTSRQRIIAGVDETVDISRRGIIIRNPLFPNERLHATAGVLALSLDDGETWSTAISPYGVAAEVIIGKLIIGEKLEIGDEEGTFTIVGNLLTIKDRNEIVRLKLGEYSSNKFGLQLMNKTGQEVVLDENGIMQTWQEGRSDNVDTSHGLTLYVYLPPTTLEVRQGLLNFRRLPFRAYAGTTESGGQTTRTSSSGGGTTRTTTSGGGTTATSSSGGGTTATSSSGGGTSTSTQSGGSSTETSELANGWDTTLIPYGSSDDIPQGTSPHSHITTIDLDDFQHWHSVNIPAHTHGFSVPNHTHSVTVPNHTHDVTIPNHSHNVTIPNHTHTVEIPAHSHGIDHGIYTGTWATGIGVIINGINRTSQLGGKFNSSQANIDIGQYLSVGQWNEIELTSDSLGRIDANIFLQVFCAT